jgi:carbonic anhydrase/acetyltransferase-like protein (isoleucine patch superfamily)
VPDFTPVDDARKATGFLTVAETIALVHGGVRVLDPFSTLVSAGTEVGAETVLYPGVVLQRDPASTLLLGCRNVIYPGSVLLAEAGGRLVLGSGCEIGPGGVQIKANQPGSDIAIGDDVRLLNGCEIVGQSRLGKGCQIIGAIAAQSIHLGGGAGGYTWPHPEERGALLKGSGLARGIRLRRGEVLNLQPDFASAAVEQQSAYHPRPARAGADAGHRAGES